MKKLLRLFPLITLVFLCNARDIRNSFNRYDIGLVCANSSSLNSTYESPFYRALYAAGQNVIKIDDAYMDSSTYDGTHAFTTLDVVIVPNFVKCPTVDTSKAGGIGDVPVIVLEDSLWDNFGFISRTDPYLYIADYTNKRIVKTQWDGTNWKSWSTLLNRQPRSISLDVASGQIDTTNIYISFYKSLVACDTLFKTTWNYGSVTKWGATGSGNYQFNRPEQIDKFGSTTGIFVADRSNGRLVYGSFGATLSWLTNTQGALHYGVAISDTSNASGYVLTGTKLYKGTTLTTIYTDSVSIGTGASGNYIWYDKASSKLYVPQSNSVPNGKIYKLSSAMVKEDSVYGSKIGVPFAVWYDWTTSYIYWSDDGGKIKRTKFNGTQYGSDLDSCFTSGSGSSQLQNPKGIVGFSSSITFTESSDDTIRIRTNIDSTTSVFNTGYFPVYKSNGGISAIDTATFYSTNILAKNKANTKATVIIDTLNSKKRIAFGLYEPSKLSIVTNGGWSLFNRAIGRLVGADADTTFNIGLVTDQATFPYVYSFNTSDSIFKNYFELNMQRVGFIAKAYADSSQFRFLTSATSFFTSSLTNWDYNDLYVTGYIGDDIDSLVYHLKEDSIPWLVLCNSNMDEFFETSVATRFYNYPDTLESMIAASGHKILTREGFNLGDTLDYYEGKTYPFVATYGLDDTYYSPSPANGAVSVVNTITNVAINGSSYPNIMASKSRYWVYIGQISDNGEGNKSIANWADELWKITESSFDWMLSSSALQAPDSIAVTALSDSSFIITWADKSSTESGFLVYLENGGEYSGGRIIVGSTGAGVEADTISGFWPKGSKWYFDVASYTAEDTSVSGSPAYGYLLAGSTPKPIVYALTDTSIQAIVNGYLQYDLFSDTTLSTSPEWYRPYGTWNVEKQYGRLRSYNTSDVSTLYMQPDSRVIQLSGSSQYFSASDGGALDETVDLDIDDFMISFWMKTSTHSRGIIEKNYSSPGHYLIYISSSATDITMYMKDQLSNVVVAVFPTTWNDNNWHHFVFIADRSGKMYLINNGVIGSDGVDISTMPGSLSNTDVITLGAAVGNYFNGSLDDIRYYRFGKDALSVSGTYAGANLIIRCGTDTLYKQTNVLNNDLVRKIYRNNGLSLTTLGFPNLDNAVRTNLHNGSGSVAGMAVGSYYYYDQGTAGHNLTVGSLVVTSDSTFKATATTGTISSGGATDYVRKVGQVTHWKLDDSGTTLNDESGNNIDLTTSGSPILYESTKNVISTKYTGSERDAWINLKFHLNDSLRLNKQWIKFYFMSTDSLGQDDGYYVYIDSTKFQVREQLNYANVDTHVTSTWTGDYKWHTLKLLNNYTKYPTYKSNTWSFYLDGTLKGTMIDTTYQDIKYVVIKTGHRRTWFDNYQFRQTTPGGNGSTVQFALQDSLTGYYLDLGSNEMESGAYWGTFEDFGEENGTTIYVSPYTQKLLRIKAKNQ